MLNDSRRYLVLLCAALMGSAAWAQWEAPSGEVTATAAIRGTRLEVAFDIPEGMHVAPQKTYFFVEPKPVAGLAFGDTVYPEATGKDEVGNPVYSGKVVLVRELKATAPVKAGTPLDLTAGWQACLDSGSCLPPANAALTAALPEMAATTPFTPTAPEAAPSAGKGFAAWAAQQGLAYFLILAFLGGMLLNLMPCVLPVLSVKLLSIAQSAHGEARVNRATAVAYTVGVLVSFGVLAGAVIALKAAGRAVGWGFQFQSPGFVMALLLVIWVFALSLFDLFVVRAPGMQAASDASNRRGLAGSFLSGVFAVLLATPCTAPLLAPALGFAFAQPVGVVLLMFLTVGLGLAFPFLIAGFIPGATKVVPKPGAWMNTFREVMGFLLLATGVWLLTVLHVQLQDHVVGVIWYLLLISFCCWLYGRFADVTKPVAQQWVFAAIVLGLAVGGWFRLVDLTAAGPAAAEEQVSGWERFSPERVASLQKEGKPVFIDFGADWCLTCKANEHGVLFTDDIKEAFRTRGVVALRGDYTKQDPVIAAWLTRFKRAGVPLYVYFPGGGGEPVVLPELLTKQIVLDVLSEG